MNKKNYFFLMFVVNIFIISCSGIDETTNPSEPSNPGNTTVVKYGPNDPAVRIKMIHNHGKK